MKKDLQISNFNKIIHFFQDNIEEIIESCPAIIRPIMPSSIFSSEQIEAMHLINRNFFCFAIRFNIIIKNNMNIKFEERSFRIIRIINVNEDNRFLQIFAEEELAHA